VQQVAKSLGHGALKRLRKDGKIRDAVFAQRLRNLWAS
jgi:ribosomal protein L25 (general stress protein Ctc)